MLSINYLYGSDYYPFGMGMPGRRGSYIYSFNGKIQDDFGRKDFQNYGMRVFDQRLSRFISVDPKASSFPFYSPFQFAGNKPIIAVDLDGLEDVITWEVTLSDGTQMVQVITREENVYFARRLELASALNLSISELPETGSLSITSTQDGFGEKLKITGAYYLATPNISPEITAFDEAKHTISRIEKRYYGEKGFINLTEDLGKGSTYVKVASPFVAATFGPNAGIATYEIGDLLGDLGSAGKMSIYATNGNWEGLKYEAEKLATQKMVNRLISKIKIDKTAEVGVKVNADLVIEEGSKE